MLKVLTIVIGCLLALLGSGSVRAAFLQECEGVIISRVPNPNPDCSEYVFCNGADSYYCNGDCTEPVSCYGSNETEATMSPDSTELATEQPAASSTETSRATTGSSSSSSSSSSKSSTLSSTRSTTSLPSTTTTNTSSLQVICRRSGQNGVYPYPANNNYYYQCIAGYLLLQQCPQHFHFDVALSQCTGSNPYQL
ncbi:uncharacterized protein [Drosophila virilis]|nr:uncharacterized protein C553.10 [Drosophila virilis]